MRSVDVPDALNFGCGNGSRRSSSSTAPRTFSNTTSSSRGGWFVLRYKLRYPARASDARGGKRRVRPHNRELSAPSPTIRTFLFAAAAALLLFLPLRLLGLEGAHARSRYVSQQGCSRFRLLSSSSPSTRSSDMVVRRLLSRGRRRRFLTTVVLHHGAVIAGPGSIPDSGREEMQSGLVPLHFSFPRRLSDLRSHGTRQNLRASLSKLLRMKARPVLQRRVVGQIHAERDQIELNENLEQVAGVANARFGRAGQF